MQSYGTIVENNFPRHKNETIQDLTTYLEANRSKQQNEKIIKTIREHFNIRSLTQTKCMKKGKVVIQYVEEYVEEDERKGIEWEKNITPNGTEYKVKDSEQALKQALTILNKQEKN